MFLLWLFIAMPILVVVALKGLIGTLWQELTYPHDLERPPEKRERPKKPEK